LKFCKSKKQSKMRSDSNCGLDGYLCLTAHPLIYLRCSYVRLAASPTRHHIFEDRGCGWHPCYTSRVDCSLHPMAQLRELRLIYVHNCRAVPLLQLNGQLTSSYERVRKTLDDSSSLKPSDIIHPSISYPRCGALRVGKLKVGHQQLSGAWRTTPVRWS
jgi:hypothetical protein